MTWNDIFLMRNELLLIGVVILILIADFNYNSKNRVVFLNLCLVVFGLVTLISFIRGTPPGVPRVGRPTRRRPPRRLSLGQQDNLSGGRNPDARLFLFDVTERPQARLGIAIEG